MSDICPKCGLPKELCICDTLTKEEQKIKIRTERRRFGKKITVIEGLEMEQNAVKDLLKQLKKKLACGGTYKDGAIELQGDHKERAKQVLLKNGFHEEMVEII